jgi:hypothetical protein
MQGKQGNKPMTRKNPSARSNALARFAAGAVLAASCLAPNAFAQKKAKIFGFYPNFDLTPMLTDAQLNLLTHVIYFSARMPSDGNLTDNYVITQINGQKLVDIIGRGQSKGVKVLLGIGGWDLSNEFAGVAGNDAKRKLFASSAAKFCKDNGLAGIDIDWEFPTGNQANLASLLSEVGKTFKPAGLIFTLSVNGQAPDYYGSSALNAADYVLIMSYDNGTPHSTYDQAVQAVNAYSGQVSAKSKLVLGVPFYGKSGGVTKSYGDLLKSNPGLSAGANDYSGYNFNGPDLIAQKAGYIVDQGGGGLMIWQVSQDGFTTAAPGGVLLAAMNKGITNKGAILDKAVVSIPGFRNPARAAFDREAGYLSSRTPALATGSYRLKVVSPDGRSVRNLNGTSGAENGFTGLAAGRYLYKLEGVAPGARTAPQPSRDENRSGR